MREIDRPRTRALRSAGILLVDPTSFFRQRLRAVIERERLGRVVEAAGGREAIDRVCESPIDVVILELILPDLDGVSVMEVMKRIDPGLRFLIVTAAATRDNVTRAADAGAEGVFCKPVEESRLSRAIKAAILLQKGGRSNVDASNRSDPR